ncbi:MAG: hypothetical protein HY922_15420 [Elusimicrobia bacterium]|nr:hypothetical protein [Elusimicrobiota bacterium]
MVGHPYLGKRKGAQLSRLAWSRDGKSVFFGVWAHEGLLRMGRPELHRVNFTGACGSQ